MGRADLAGSQRCCGHPSEADTGKLVGDDGAELAVHAGRVLEKDDLDALDAVGDADDVSPKA
jgi:hypothetical protein